MGELAQKRTMMKYFIPALCLAFTFGIGAASAEMKPAKEPESLRSADPKPRSAKSIECSKQADAKGLHGKERQAFRSKCKRGEK
jgi:hypothetical protein